MHRNIFIFFILISNISFGQSGIKLGITGGAGIGLMYISDLGGRN